MSTLLDKGGKPLQGAALAARVASIDRQIALGCKAIRTAWVALAGLLTEFHDQRGWELTGYDSMEAWLASPEIDLGRTQALRLIRCYRELVEVRQIPASELEGVDITKADVVLGAIKDGTVSRDEALADCRSLSRTDLEVKYREGPNGRLNAEDEPPFCKCTECGQVHRQRIES